MKSESVMRALVGGEDGGYRLADDFNIPKGWRMQVKFAVLFPNIQTPTRWRQVGCWIYAFAWRYPALPLLFTRGR